MSQVSLAPSTDSYQGTFKTLQPLKAKLQKKLQKLNRIVIKINLVSSEVKLAATPLATVKAFIDFIKPFYPGRIIIAEEATLGDTLQGFRRFGFFDLAAGDPQVTLLDSAKSPTQKVKLSSGSTLPLAQIYLDSPFIVSLCRAKTHDVVVVTLGIKNLLVGAVQKKLFNSRVKIHLGQNLHRHLVSLARCTYPHLVLIDGTVGMQGDGPVDGSPIKAGWLIASFDALAADSLACYLMGFDIADVGYLNLLRAANFGLLYPADSRKIKIIGPSPSSLRTPFQPHPTFLRQRRWR